MDCKQDGCYAPDVGCHQGNMKLADCPNWKIENDREAQRWLHRLAKRGYTSGAIVAAFVRAKSETS